MFCYIGLVVFYKKVRILKLGLLFSKMIASLLYQNEIKLNEFYSNRMKVELYLCIYNSIECQSLVKK